MAEIWLFLFLIGCNRFPRYFGKMCSYHWFFLLRIVTDSEQLNYKEHEHNRSVSYIGCRIICIKLTCDVNSDLWSEGSETIK